MMDIHKLLFIAALSSPLACIPFSKGGQTSESSELNAMTKDHPLPPLSVKIREKALQLRSTKDPRNLGVLAGAENEQLPDYLKEIILSEVAGQKWVTGASSERPCFVNPKLKQPREIFYAIQRAAFGTARESSLQNIAPDQGVPVSPIWSGLRWANIVGYELVSYKLLDQIESWLSQINPDTLSSMEQESLGLKQVPIPEKFRIFVRRNLVRNDLDLVVNRMGRDRAKIRCFLAHQVSSIIAIDQRTGNIVNHVDWLISMQREFPVFESFKEADFGILNSVEDLNSVNQFLSFFQQVIGLKFDIKWNDRSSRATDLVFDPKLLETKLAEPIRKRITRFYGRLGYLDFLPADFVFKIFPNLTHFSLRKDNDGQAIDDDARRFATILVHANIKKIKNIRLERFADSSQILKQIKNPLEAVENLELYSNDLNDVEISDLARVFPKAKKVAISSMKVSLDPQKLTTLQKQNVKVAWEKIFLTECSTQGGAKGSLNFIHPIFTDPKFKVTTYSCTDGLSIEQAPTMDDIIEKLAHRLHYQQIKPGCVQ